jgi:hypothetical protein
MSIDRRKFINGVAGSLLSYDFLKPSVLKLLGETHRTSGSERGAFNPQIDIDPAIWRRPQLVIQLEDPEETIKPGQPISLAWAVYDPISTWTFPPRPSDRYSSLRITFFDRGNPFFGPTRQRTLTIPTSAVPRDFYHIDRTRLVTAELSDPSDAVVTEAHFYLLVIRDNPPTWVWGDVPARTRWNRDHYTLTGTLHNNAEYSKLTFDNLILSQNEQVGGTPILLPRQFNPVASGPYSVEHGHEMVLSFPEISQDWPWFNRTTLVQFQPFSRLFNYSVNIMATDDYDNQYVGTPDTRQVLVEVEQQKLNEEALALAALINALISTIIAAIYQWAAGLATTWWLAVDRLTAAALDPPEPDFDYLTLVQQENLKPSDPSAAMRLVTLILQIANTPQTLGAIESKLMGANLNISPTGVAALRNAIAGVARDNAAKGLALQQRSYIDTIRNINGAAQQLGKLLPAVLQELHSRADLDDKRIQIARETFANGIPSDLMQTMRAAGLSKNAEIMLVNAVRNPELMKQLPDVDMALTNAVKQAVLLTLTLQNETPKVLQGKLKRVLKSATVAPCK